MLVDAIYPLNYSFLHEWFPPEDPCSDHYRLNWWTANLASAIAIGVFADRRDIFDDAVDLFRIGRNNANIVRAAWYVHENGLAQAEELWGILPGLGLEVALQGVGLAAATHDGSHQH
jgi:hypothetical protein